MIRLKIQLLPAGVEEFAAEYDQVIIGCKFPLQPKKQNLFILSGMDVAEIKGYNLEDTLYHPPDGKPRIHDLIFDCLLAMRKKKRTRQGGEIYPGSKSLRHDAFDDLMAGLVRKLPDEIQEIRLYGQRA